MEWGFKKSYVYVCFLGYIAMKVSIFFYHLFGFIGGVLLANSVHPDQAA